MITYASCPVLARSRSSDHRSEYVVSKVCWPNAVVQAITQETLPIQERWRWNEAARCLVASRLWLCTKIGSRRCKMTQSIDRRPLRKRALSNEVDPALTIVTLLEVVTTGVDLDTKANVGCRGWGRGVLALADRSTRRFVMNGDPRPVVRRGPQWMLRRLLQHGVVSVSGALTLTLACSPSAED